MRGLRGSLERFGTTIFTEMSRLAAEHQAVNLGQGFPDFAGPEFLKHAAVRAIHADHNQYARMAGAPELVRAIAAKVARATGLDYDPMEEVTVFSGCTEAIHDTILALTEPGDEVVVLEPFYDSYLACIAMAGATARTVRLHPPSFRWHPEDLERAFTPRTRLVLVNTPHNPTGRVLDRAELEAIARLATQHDAIVVTDEVYEHLVFAGEHVPMATLPGMRARTVTLNSTGKTYSMTGWKIGYATAPAPLSRALRTVHQFVTFATATPFQQAMVEALTAPASYYQRLNADYSRRRTFLIEALRDVGFEVYPNQGTYFVTAGIEPFGFVDDTAFCRHMIAAAGVVAIPPSAFYANRDPVSYVRFAFCKKDETLHEAARRLREHAPQLRKPSSR